MGWENVNPSLRTCRVLYSTDPADKNQQLLYTAQFDSDVEMSMYHSTYMTMKCTVPRNVQYHFPSVGVIDASLVHSSRDFYSQVLAQGRGAAFEHAAAQKKIPYRTPYFDCERASGPHIDDTKSVQPVQHRNPRAHPRILEKLTP